MGADVKPITAAYNDGKWFEYPTREYITGVTHWQDLPEPPK